MPTETVLPVRAEAFGAMFTVVQHLSRLADRELANLGLTSRQWLLLAVLTNGFADAQPSLSEAAALYGSSRQNVKQVALGLQERGFVRLITDPDDARTTRIELTERIAEFDEPVMIARTEAMLDEAFTGLTNGQTLELLRLLRRWLAALTTPIELDPNP